MLEVARANARRAGVRLAFRQGDVRELRGWAPPLAIVTNPPYGVRMTADSAFFRQFGAVELNVALTALVIGSALLLLSAFWQPARALVIAWLPMGARAMVPSAAAVHPA